ncbi:hypothetical protein [Dictyobacter kobayashii]|nr:hypothetical protein [Dictyobacter kobayashii]
MKPVEELRYLILAAQREGNRMLAEDLRPWMFTPFRPKSCACCKTISRCH